LNGLIAGCVATPTAVFFKGPKLSKNGRNEKTEDFTDAIKFGIY
jgi:hypothetical protein